MCLKMDALKGWITILVLVISFQGGHGFYSSVRSRDVPLGRDSRNDCPLQCRCIALSHLGYRDMAERWMTMSQIHPSSREVWKGTEAPVWREEPNRLQGRDVVCMGLNKVPRPLPKDRVSDFRSSKGSYSKGPGSSYSSSSYSSSSLGSGGFSSNLSSSYSSGYSSRSARRTARSDYDTSSSYSSSSLGGLSSRSSRKFVEQSSSSLTSRSTRRSESLS